MKRTREIVTRATPETVVPAVAEMTIPAQPEHRRTVTETICDVCEKKEAFGACYVCGRDICGKCFSGFDINRVGGDYAEKYVCRLCLALRDKYWDKEIELEEEQAKQDEALREEWKAESLGAKPCKPS